MHIPKQVIVITPALLPHTGFNMTNRYVPIITGTVCLGIGATLIFGIGSWWAWLIGTPIGIFGWMSLKMGFSAADDEVAAMTSFDPMSKEMKQRIQDRL
jgi:hypothetical protein